MSLRKMILPLFLSFFLFSCSGSLVVETDPKLVANPPGGVYSNIKRIDINADKAAVIYYTLDGSDPYDNPESYQYDPTRGILVGNQDFNQTVVIKFYAVTKQADGSLGKLIDKVYEEKYVILSDQVPPVTKPSISYGIFSKPFDLEFISNEEATTQYCVMEQTVYEDCNPSVCYPDIDYLGGQKINIFSSAASSRDLSSEATTKFCLVYQSTDKSGNVSPMQNYEYLLSKNAPDISQITLDKRIMTVDQISEVHFQSSDMKETITEQKLKDFEKSLSQINFNAISDDELDQLKANLTEAKKEFIQKNYRPLKMEIVISGGKNVIQSKKKINDISDLIYSSLPENLTYDSSHIYGLIYKLGISLFEKPLPFLNYQTSTKNLDTILSLNQNQTRLQLLGSSLIDSSQSYLKIGDNQVSIFLIDESSKPFGISGFTFNLRMKINPFNGLNSLGAPHIARNNQRSHKLISSRLSAFTRQSLKTSSL